MIASRIRRQPGGGGGFGQSRQTRHRVLRGTVAAESVARRGQLAGGAAGCLAGIAAERTLARNSPPDVPAPQGDSLWLAAAMP